MKNKLKFLFNVLIATLLFVFLFQVFSFASTDQAAIYFSSDFAGEQCAKDAANYAGLTFRKLGYNLTTVNGANLYVMTNSNQTVLNYITGSGNNYGLYVSSHGGTGWFSMQLNGSTKIYPSDIKGNWHFVFLDSCRSLANGDFASAFKTTSAYSNRAILGWYKDVTTGASAEFWPHFYSFAGTESLRDCALDAASNCVADTPIRFYGDSSWNGYAW